MIKYMNEINYNNDMITKKYVAQDSTVVFFEKHVA